MGKKSTPAPPPAPDPREIARVDSEFNRINQITPYGSLTYSGPNRNTSTLELSPELRGLFDQQLQSDQNMLGQALQRQQGLNPNPIDLSQFGDIQSDIDQTGINFNRLRPTGLPALRDPNLLNVGAPGRLQNAQGLQALGNVGLQQQFQGDLNTEGLPGIPQDIQGYRGDVEQAFFDRQRALLDPVLSDQQRDLTNTLANRGLPESGEAFDRDTTRFYDARNRAYTDLSRNAVLAGGSEASRQLGDTLAARGQGFGEQLAGAGLANQAGVLGNQAQLGNQGFNNQNALAQFGAGLQQTGFNNDATTQGFQNQLAQTGFNNQRALQGLGAAQANRGQLFGEQARVNDAGNQASALNLGLQQQLLGNNNAARAQALAEAQGIRGNQFNELQALLGGQQVQQPGINDFYAPSQANVLGAYGLNQQAQQNAYNAQLQNSGNALSGLFGLGGSILGGPVGAAAGSAIGNLFGQAPPQAIPGGYYGGLG